MKGFPTFKGLWLWP